LPDDPLIVARALERALRELAGVAGLDPHSRLATRTGGAGVRGAWLRPEVGGQLSMQLELVGLEGARLAPAADEARRLAARQASEQGWTPGTIDVAVTDVAPGPLPLQSPPPEPQAPPSPPQAAPAPPPPPHATPAPPQTAPTARISLPGDGRRTVLVITVEVMEEPA
jgi:hypothetical protein